MATFIKSSIKQSGNERLNLDFVGRISADVTADRCYIAFFTHPEGRHTWFYKKEEENFYNTDLEKIDSLMK